MVVSHIVTYRRARSRKLYFPSDCYSLLAWNCSKHTWLGSSRFLHLTLLALSAVILSWTRRCPYMMFYVIRVELYLYIVETKGGPCHQDVLGRYQAFFFLRKPSHVTREHCTEERGEHLGTSLGCRPIIIIVDV